MYPFNAEKTVELFFELYAVLVNGKPSLHSPRRPLIPTTLTPPLRCRSLGSNYGPGRLRSR